MVSAVWYESEWRGLEGEWLVGVALARKIINNAVGQVQPPHIDGNSGKVITVGSYDLQLRGDCSVHESR